MKTPLQKRVWVHAGRHYGRIHRVLAIDGSHLTVIHEPSDDVVTVHWCDVESEPLTVDPDLSMPPVTS